ncbi:hypothetical protein PINS_up008503 [Pythium insidiosum]|nr:hypothetical protein PINS_up008503 [Pythium insidiosum]
MPTWLGNFTVLRHLNLRENHLKGALPVALAQNMELEVLYVPSMLFGVEFFFVCFLLYWLQRRRTQPPQCHHVVLFQHLHAASTSVRGVDARRHFHFSSLFFRRDLAANEFDLELPSDFFKGEHLEHVYARQRDASDQVES